MGQLMPPLNEENCEGKPALCQCSLGTVNEKALLPMEEKFEECRDRCDFSLLYKTPHRVP